METNLSGEFSLRRPELNEPDAKSWMDRIEAETEGLPKEAILIGHSLGGTMLLQMIATRKPGLNVDGMLLVALPFWGAPDWTYEDFLLPEDFALGLTGIGKIVHVHSQDDEIADFSHQDMYRKAMPQARYIAMDGFGHSFARGDRALVLKIIRGF